jgi:hypothetical protein
MEIYAVAENIGVSYLMFYNSSRAEESVRPPAPGGPTLAWARTGDSAMLLQYFQHEFADLAATWQFVPDVKFYQVTKPDLIE